MAKKSIKPAQSLINALKFIKPAQKKTGTEQQRFCKIKDNMVVASDGVITIGCPVEEDLEVCVNTFQFLDALEKCEFELSITQTSEENLSVVSEDFNASISCNNLERMFYPEADANIAPCGNSLKSAFKLLQTLAKPNATEALFGSVMVQANTAVATDGYLLAEYWHGLNLPPNMMIPKIAANLISKIKTELIGFGYADNASSATFWFEDGSFVKTQLYDEQFPNYLQKLECKEKPVELHEEFFNAIEKVSLVSRSGLVYFNENGLHAELEEQNAATYRIKGLPENMAFQANELLLGRKHFTRVFFDIAQNQAFFFGHNCRAALRGCELD